MACDISGALEEAPILTVCDRLGVGYAHRGTRILAVADDTTVTVIALITGEILSTHDIDPSRTYWRNTQKSPGRWPGPN